MMVKDDQERATKRLPYHGVARKLVVLALIGVSVAGLGVLLMAGMGQQPAAGPVAEPPPSHTIRLKNWPKPDVVLVLSGQQMGYLQPCGCSPIQLGGLPRRYNLIQSLTKRGWPVVAADLGDVAQTNGPQALLKYKYSMRALKQLNYSAVGIGLSEMVNPLVNALAEYSLENPLPRVLAANLKDKDTQFPTDGKGGSMVGSYQLAGGNGVPRIGFVGVVGPSVAKQGSAKDPAAVFDPVDKVLPSAVQELQKDKPELLVLLYQGTEAEAKKYAEQAKANPEQLPVFSVILCLSEGEEAASRPLQVGDSLIISVGHKGRYVGVLGAYRMNKPEQPFGFRYELVALEPDYETPDGKDKQNPLHALMEEYAKEVKRENYLARYPQSKHPLQLNDPMPTYVGSQKCKKCHTEAFTVWKDHPHSQAYQTLVHRAKRPTLRQFDGECVQCHVTGFGYLTGFKNEVDTPKLLGVGCESCHGPASLHVDNPKNPQLQQALNPWKLNATDRKAVLRRIDDSCQKCHDTDNSVNYKFDLYWDSKSRPKTAHYTDKAPE